MLLVGLSAFVDSVTKNRREITRQITRQIKSCNKNYCTTFI